MRLVRCAWVVLLFGVPPAACTLFGERADCDKNPYHCWSADGGDAGTGRPPPCGVPTDCAVPANGCKERTCDAGLCGEADKDCGGLECDPASGKCVGCDAQKRCPAKECQAVTCDDGVCDEAPSQGDEVCANGAGKCAGGTCQLDQGQPCGPSDVCESGHCVDDLCCETECDDLCVRCDPSGTCSPLPEGDLDDTVIDGKSCGVDAGGCSGAAGVCRCDDGVKNGDEHDVDCGGSCARKCNLGASCSIDLDCESGHCVGAAAGEAGTCCNRACDGKCETCDRPDSPGVCVSPVPGSDDSSCSDGEVCGAFGTCLRGNGDGCNDGAQCASGFCNKSLDPDQCASCTFGACPAGGRCIGAGSLWVCIPARGKGESCQTKEWCEGSLECVDGVCCSGQCTGTCMSCRSEYTGEEDGTCAAIQAGFDPFGECHGSGAGAACSGVAAPNGDSSCGASPP